MLNLWSGTGRIANDLELKYTQSEIPVLSFRLAVDRKYKNRDGERETDFINCVVWRKTAEVMSEHLSKGSLIGVEGNIQTRSYENNKGQTIYMTEVVVDNFAFLESKSQSQSNNNSFQGSYSSNQQNGSQSNFGGNQAEDDNPFKDSDIVEDILDSDLPF